MPKDLLQSNYNIRYIKNASPSLSLTLSGGAIAPHTLKVRGGSSNTEGKKQAGQEQVTKNIINKKDLELEKNNLLRCPPYRQMLPLSPLEAPNYPPLSFHFLPTNCPFPSLTHFEMSEGEGCCEAAPLLPLPPLPHRPPFGGEGWGGVGCGAGEVKKRGAGTSSQLGGLVPRDVRWRGLGRN